jgi:hypothetical protein
MPAIEGTESIDLDDLRDAMNKTDPDLVSQASAEFSGIRSRLSAVVTVLDRHITALDEHWTTGDDAREVKTQLRRLRDAADAVVTAIRPESPDHVPSGHMPSTGIAPALDQYAATLTAFRGDNVPDHASGLPLSEMGHEAMDYGKKGGAGGFVIGAAFDGIGAVPGTAIGSIAGTVVGGVHALISGNDDRDRKAAAEHLRKLSEATSAANDVFPADLVTDVPVFTYTPTMPDLDVDLTPLHVGHDADVGDSTTRYDPSSPAGPPGALRGVGDTGTDGAGLGGADLDGSGLDGGWSPGYGSGNGTGGADGTGLGGGGLDGTGTTGLGGGTSADPALTGSNGSSAGSSDHGSDLAGQWPGADPTGGRGSAYPGGTGIGTGAGYGAGQGSGYGAGVPTGPGVTGAGARMGGTGSMMPLLPYGGGTAEEERERERTTHLLEDDDVFTSDRAVTPQRIDHSSKDRT